jgi:hypothetical protein
VLEIMLCASQRCIPGLTYLGYILRMDARHRALKMDRRLRSNTKDVTGFDRPFQRTTRDIDEPASDIGQRLRAQKILLTAAQGELSPRTLTDLDTGADRNGLPVQINATSCQQEWDTSPISRELILFDRTAAMFEDVTNLLRDTRATPCIEQTERVAAVELLSRATT